MLRGCEEAGRESRVFGGYEGLKRGLRTVSESAGMSSRSGKAEIWGGVGVVSCRGCLVWEGELNVSSKRLQSVKCSPGIATDSAHQTSSTVGSLVSDISYPHKISTNTG